jgi:hypothetical protein
MIPGNNTLVWAYGSSNTFAMHVDRGWFDVNIVWSGTQEPTSKPTPQPTRQPLQAGQTWSPTLGPSAGPTKQPVVTTFPTAAPSIAPTSSAPTAAGSWTINAFMSLSWVVGPRVSDPVNFTLTYAGLGWLGLGVYKGMGDHMIGGTGLVAVVGAGVAVVAKQLSSTNTAQITTVADSNAGLVSGSASLLQSASMSLASCSYLVLSTFLIFVYYFF